MSARNNHWPCPGGCNELADECMCSRPNPLGSMQIHDPWYGYGHPPCCDCSDAEYGNCFDCLNTGHAHAKDSPTQEQK